MPKLSLSRPQGWTLAACCAALTLSIWAPIFTRSTSGATLAGEPAWVHDPSRIIEDKGKYYVFATGDGIPSRVSSDKVNWQKGPAVLEKVPDWMQKLVPKANGKFIWAPDVIKVGPEFWLFYSYSTFGSQISAIGLLSSPTLDPQKPNYKWADRGLVIATDGKQKANAIDPALIFDPTGDLWMTYGSWDKGGILVVALDKTTGKPIGAPKTIAAGQATGPEAPYLHFRDGYYYLFENEGFCCRGLNSTYKVMMGRSKSISGPYLDKTGKDLARGGGSVFLETAGEVVGPGHIGILSEGGSDSFTFHFYDGKSNGVPTLGRQTLIWDAQGWPVAAPDLPGGRYVLTNVASGLALGIRDRDYKDGAALDQFAYSGDSMQKWNVIPLGDGYYGIASLETGKYLDRFECGTKDGTKINQQPWFNNDCQRFRIEAVGDGAYRLLAKGAQTALTVPADTKEPRTLVQSDTYRGAAGQKWRFQPLP